MTLENFKINNLRAFIPSKDYQKSRAFYKKLGFEETYYSEELAVFQIGGFSFYLQKFYNKSLAENLMMFLDVDNVDDFWKYLESLDLKKDYPNVRLRAPQTEDWGRECILIDPTGVLWHFATFA